VADRDSLLRTIGVLEQQRDLLGEAATELALAPLRSRLAALDTDTPITPTLAEPPSERKVVTVIFVDIVGFTSMSERLESEAIVDIVNGLFDRLTPIIERYGGTVDKFIGDEIMAVFGAPAQPSATRNTRCVRRSMCFGACGLQPRSWAGARAPHCEQAWSPALWDPGEYSVTGDTVNVAARLGSAAAAGCILVGPSTFRHASHVFDFEALEPLPLKGKANPLPVYRLVGEKSRYAKYRDDGLQLAFSGRSNELELVVTRLRSDTPPGRGVIGIVAEPGVGKSRLVSELHARMEGEVRWIEASAREYERCELRRAYAGWHRGPGEPLFLRMRSPPSTRRHQEAPTPSGTPVDPASEEMFKA
jgi:class 3 adenylate cyclase